MKRVVRGRNELQHLACAAPQRVLFTYPVRGWLRAACALLAAGVVALGAACERKPVVVKRAKPVMGQVDVAPFLQAGCVRTENRLDCKGVAELHAKGCDDLEVDDSLAALSPKVPVVACWSDGRGGIRSSGCMAPAYLRHVLWVDGAFHVERSADSFTRRFAPIETPEEALALAVALTGARADHELDYPTLRAKVARMETTFAEAQGDGFRVRLFDDGGCGCSLHPISAVDFHVTRDGGIERRRSEEIFELTEAICYD